MFIWHFLFDPQIPKQSRKMKQGIAKSSFFVKDPEIVFYKKTKSILSNIFSTKKEQGETKLAKSGEVDL